MASRGTVNRLGVVTTSEYSPVDGGTFLNATELTGNNGNHGLPDYSHTSPNRIYVKTDIKGFREMRIYGDDGKVTLEIGYHPEKNLSSDGQRVLHYHIYDSNLNRTIAKPMKKEVYNKYKDYLNHWGIYWHE